MKLIQGNLAAAIALGLVLVASPGSANKHSSHKGHHATPTVTPAPSEQVMMPIPDALNSPAQYEIAPPPTDNAAEYDATAPADSNVAQNDDDVDPVTCLAAHNKVRAAVGVPALTWDATLAAKGVSWAQHMEDLNFFDHNTPGQDDSQMNNLYSGTSCLDAVAAFESEKSMLPADHIVREENYMDYGHYSMMVWRTTTRVGCGRGATKNLVCYYEEPGNVVGEAAY